MRDEIAAAVVFLTRVVRHNDNIGKDKSEEFSDKLSAVLVERFKNHWYKEEPTKGQGYRCIRINEAEPVDPVLEKVAIQCSLDYIDLRLPSEFTLWIDPEEVIARFGETIGSQYTVATFRKEKKENYAQTLDLSQIIQDHWQRKCTELTKLREACRRRGSNAAKSKNNYTNFNQQKKWQQQGVPAMHNGSFMPHQRSSPVSKPFYAPPKISPPYGRSASPSHVWYNASQGPVLQDRYRWVKGQSGVVAQ